MEKFTIEEIRNYIESQDSLRDVMYNLKEENIKWANKTITFTLEEILHSGNDWDDFCNKYGYSQYTVNEGGGDVQVQLKLSDAKKYGLV